MITSCRTLPSRYLPVLDLGQKEKEERRRRLQAAQQEEQSHTGLAQVLDAKVQAERPPADSEVKV